MPSAWNSGTRRSRPAATFLNSSGDGLRWSISGGWPRAKHPVCFKLMVFTKRLREGIRRGRIRCSVRIWTRLHVKAGGRYRMDDGHIVVDSIVPISVADITYDLARESGFNSVEDLLQTAKHGRGDKAYLIRFHYLRPGAWDAPAPSVTSPAGASRRVWSASRPRKSTHLFRARDRERR